MENQGPRGPRGKMRALLIQLIVIFGRTRTNGEIASHSTTTSVAQALHTCFNNLYDLGYNIQDPKNLDGRHVAALCRHWHQRTLKVSTIQSRLSALRIFSGWIGKPGMVTSLQDYLPDVDKNKLKVRKVATDSKSWSDHGIDVAEK